MKNKQERKKRKKLLHRLGFFLQNGKNPETEIFAFCVITFEPIKIWTCLNPSFVKEIHVICKKHIQKTTEVAIYCLQILGISLYYKLVLLQIAAIFDYNKT